MTTEESALQVDWRSDFQEPNAHASQPASAAVSPDLHTVTDVQPETSVVELSAVLIIILGGMATTFALGAIMVFLGSPG
jgi:hypothetical protein